MFVCFCFLFSQGISQLPAGISGDTFSATPLCFGVRRLWTIPSQERTRSKLENIPKCLRDHILLREAE